MNVLEIASVQREVIEEFGKCIFFVKGDKSITLMIGAYCNQSRTIYGDNHEEAKLGWFTHLMVVDALYE
jgi:hypothetical protein